MKTMEEMWLEFSTALSIQPGSPQWNAMRPAFFSGCVTMLGEVRPLLDGPEADCFRELRRLNREGQQWLERMKDRKE